MFGAKPASASVSFGSTPASTAAGSTSLFGTTTQKPLFGATSTTTTTPLFGTTSTPPNKLFANTPATTSLFGAPTTATTTTTGFAGFSSGGGGLFSKPAAASFGTTTTNFGGKSSLFGAPTAAVAPANASFGARANLQTIIQNSEAVVGCVTRVELYGDERDRTITRLNQVAASLGVGKAQYKKDQGVEFDKNGPFYRLKCIGYNADSVHSDEDGLVMLILSVPPTHISTSQQRQAVVDELFKILDSKPELKARIERVQPLNDTTTKLVVYVTQAGMGRVKATQLAAFFHQPAKKAALQTQLRVDPDSISALMAMDSQKKKLYMRSIPQGFDESVWDEALRMNPCPARLIPYPIRGFDQLVARQKAHSTQVESQKKLLDMMDDRCKWLEASLANAKGRSEACVEQHKMLSHRLLRIMAVEELNMRFAHCIDEREEEMQTVLEGLNAAMNAPNGLKNRLSTILDTVLTEPALKNAPKQNAFTQHNLTQLKKYLSKCQDGLESLSHMIQANSEDSKAMERCISTGL